MSVVVHPPPCPPSPLQRLPPVREALRIAIYVRGVPCWVARSKPNVKIHSLGARRGHINVEYQRPIQSARRARACARALLAYLISFFVFYTIGANVKLKTECSKPNVKNAFHSLGARRGHINVEYQRPIQSALSWLI